MVCTGSAWLDRKVYFIINCFYIVILSHDT